VAGGAGRFFNRNFPNDYAKGTITLDPRTPSMEGGAWRTGNNSRREENGPASKKMVKGENSQVGTEIRWGEELMVKEQGPPELKRKKIKKLRRV